MARNISLPPVFVIYTELNRHGISRKRENAEWRCSMCGGEVSVSA